MKDIIRLAILAVVVLAPMFIMASELSGDEFAKSAIGVVMGAVVLAAMKMMDSRRSELDEK